MNAMPASNPIILDGANLTPETVVRAAQGVLPVELSEAARERIVAGRAVVEAALASGEPVYGLTTGLGDRVTERLPDEVLREFSVQVLRGRATATGEPLPAAVVRALMVVRLNGLATGGSGASPAVADQLLAVLNAGLIAEMPAIGSSGANDLCIMAHLGLALIGEGRFLDADGTPVAADAMLARHGLAPLALGPKDGLALCSNSAFSAGRAALALCDAGRTLESAQTIAAMTMEGFRANPSPLDPRAGAARPQPGQQQAAAGLLQRLEGSALLQAGGPRRLQDPVSLRCLASVHGGAYAALAYLRAAVEPELNAAADNPLVLVDEQRIISTGNFQMPVLAVALDGLGQALVHVAVAAAGRCMRLLTAHHTDLPSNLSPHWPQGSGMAQLFQPVEALLAEIRHDAAATLGELSVGAKGVEDTAVYASFASAKLLRLLGHLEQLLAIEAVMAAQAIDLAGVEERLPPVVAAAHGRVRALVPPMDADMAMSPHVRNVAQQLVHAGELTAAGSSPPGSA